LQVLSSVGSPRRLVVLACIHSFPPPFFSEISLRFATAHRAYYYQFLIFAPFPTLLSPAADCLGFSFYVFPLEIPTSPPTVPSPLVQPPAFYVNGAFFFAFVPPTLKPRRKSSWGFKKNPSGLFVSPCPQGLRFFPLPPFSLTVKTKKTLPHFLPLL